MNLQFTMLSYDDMPKTTKRGYSTLLFYWLDNNKPSNFDLPLFVGDDGKGCLSVETFKKVFWAFQVKIGYSCNAFIKSEKADDEKSYNVVHIELTDKPMKGLIIDSDVYIEPKKVDKKRESSAKTKAKSEAKKHKAKQKKSRKRKNLMPIGTKKQLKH